MLTYSRKEEGSGQRQLNNYSTTIDATITKSLENVIMSWHGLRLPLAIYLVFTVLTGPNSYAETPPYIIQGDHRDRFILSGTVYGLQERGDGLATSVTATYAELDEGLHQHIS